MAEKLGALDTLLGGEYAERLALNRNARELEHVEDDVAALRKLVDRQADDILHLRAMVAGLVEVLRAKAPFDDAELTRAADAAYAKLTAPKPPLARPTATGEASAADIEAATALLKTAQDHHFSERFAEAREVYEQIVQRYGTTKQAAVAWQQLQNLRNA